MAKRGLIEVRYDESKLRRIEHMVRGIPRAMPRIMSRSINRTATSARTNVARKISSEIKVKVSTAKKGIRITKATFARWVAKLAISGKRIPLINFGARQTKKGVSYQINKISGRKKIKSAFIQSMPITGAGQEHGHRGVFMRKGKERLPIRELFGPSIGIVFENAPQVAARAMVEAGAELAKNINSQLDYVLSRARGAA